MKKLVRRKTAAVGMSIAVTATLLGGFPAHSAPLQSPWDDAAASAEIEFIRSAVYVAFQDMSVHLPSPPQLINGTMMVPGESLLKGLGYATVWDDAEQKLTASHLSKPALEFLINRKEVILNGERITDIPAAPFLKEQTIWIPLRLTVESIGYKVSWDAAQRLAVVSDPLALPRIRIATRADQAVSGSPLMLTAFMKDRMKANVQIDLIGPEHYREKTNILIASGDMRDLMLLQDAYQYQDVLFEGIALDLTDALEAFPRLKKLAEAGGRKIDGKIYGIPRPSDPHDALFPAIRQDWLNVLGLVQPQTMEEVYEVLKQFVTRDPDGNGKHDTIGMAGYIHADGLGSLSWVEHAYTGSPERFSIQDGRVIDHAVSSEEELALKWLTRAYAEGLIDKEFPVASQDQVQHQISSNQVGLAAMGVGNAAALSSEAAEWVPLARLKADSTATSIAPWNTKGSGMYIISTMSKHEPKLLLEWLDRGIAMSENKEWDSMNGFEPADYSAIRNLFGQANLLDSPAISELPAALQSAYQSAVKEWRNTSYSDQSIPEVNGIWSTGKYAELNSQLEQFKIKVIVGAASLEDWKQFTKELVTTDEYQEMMTELNKLAAGSRQ